MNDTELIRRCPHCGMPPKTGVGSELLPCRWHVMCINYFYCPQAWAVYAESKAEAIAKWNHYATQQKGNQP